MTPAHLLHGRRITCLPHQEIEIDELTDPTYGEASQFRKKARLQATVLSDFKKRWCHEYLTSLREYHKASGENHQAIKKGDVVIVHNDTARATWKLAVIEDLIVVGPTAFWPPRGCRSGLTRTCLGVYLHYVLDYCTHACMWLRPIVVLTACACSVLNPSQPRPSLVEPRDWCIPF